MKTHVALLLAALCLLPVPGALGKMVGVEVETIPIEQARLLPPGLPWAGPPDRERVPPETPCAELYGGRPLGIPCHLYAEHGVVCLNRPGEACSSERSVGLSVYAYPNSSAVHTVLRMWREGWVQSPPAEPVHDSPGDGAVRWTYIGAYTHTAYLIAYRNFAVQYYGRTLDTPAGFNRTLVQSVLDRLDRVDASPVPRSLATFPAAPPSAGATPRQPGFEVAAAIAGLAVLAWIQKERR